MSKKFDKFLEQATDSTNLEPNWDGIIACFDFVRAGEVPAKAALTSLQKRIQHDNPHVVQYALLVLDACVKNCGPKFHSEVATRDFMEFFKNLAIENKYEKVKAKALEMLQCWAMAFANKPEYKIVVDTHNLLKLAGFDFPSIKEADAMFMAQVAPDWADGSECYRCRTEFGLLTRKHHCRACGQIFCDRCSSHEMPLPQFGIEKEVRVCDACFEKGVKAHNEKALQARQNVQEKKIMEMLGDDVVSQAEKDKLLREKEEEDLMKALELSKMEAEKKEKQQKDRASLFNGDHNYYSNDQGSASSTIDNGYKGAASIVPESPSELSLAADDPLARYMNRDYWQQRKNKVEEWAANNTASAPAPSEVGSVATMSVAAEEPLYQVIGAQPIADVITDSTVEAHADETTKWCQQLREQVAVMENRIRSNIARGRPVVNDTAIQGLFLRLTEYHSQVLQRMHRLDEDRGYYEGLQDQVNRVVDARSAITELREDHARRKREQIEAEQRARQAQMKQTLDLMRMKKHAMLLEQRDVALQRFQQQEQEMQARRQQPQPIYANSGYMQQPMPTHVYNNPTNNAYNTSYFPNYPQQYSNIQPPPQQHNQYTSVGHNIVSFPSGQSSNSAPNVAMSGQQIYMQPAYVMPHEVKPQVMPSEQNGYGYPVQHTASQPTLSQQPSNNTYPYSGQIIPQTSTAPPVSEPVNDAPLICFD